MIFIRRCRLCRCSIDFYWIPRITCFFSLDELFCVEQYFINAYFFFFFFFIITNRSARKTNNFTELIRKIFINTCWLRLCLVLSADPCFITGENDEGTLSVNGVKKMKSIDFNSQTTRKNIVHLVITRSWKRF